MLYELVYCFLENCFLISKVEFNSICLIWRGRQVFCLPGVSLLRSVIVLFLLINVSLRLQWLIYWIKFTLASFQIGYIWMSLPHCKVMNKALSINILHNITASMQSGFLSMSYHAWGRHCTTEPSKIHLFISFIWP